MPAHRPSALMRSSGATGRDNEVRDGPVSFIQSGAAKKLTGFENHSDDPVAVCPPEEHAAAARHGAASNPKRRSPGTDLLRNTAKIPTLLDTPRLPAKPNFAS
jgi:hypothetical protein